MKQTFEEACALVQAVMEGRWRAADDEAKAMLLEREKRAIMGYEEEIESYQADIRAILAEADVTDAGIPPWYRSAEEGVFAELYGLAGLTPWVYDATPAYQASSSAKLIGDRLYCLIDGKTVLQPQRISRERRAQLRRALLLSTPQERVEKGFHEIYLHNGIRVTIYAGDRTKPEQEIIVFRKYLLKDLSFENLAELGTIPREAIPLFRDMIRIGFNILIGGPVRSGKTTFLQIWQREEDPSLEGLAISTDPETPWHVLMPDAPIMQIVADGAEALESLTKSLLRGDNDYVLLEEMRDAAAYRLALEITAIGTRRCKCTIHTQDPEGLPYRMASKICARYGGQEQNLMQQICKNFHYVFEFAQVEEDRSRKLLKRIVEYCCEPESGRVAVHTICKYDPHTQAWNWHAHFGEDKKEIGLLYPKEAEQMQIKLKSLEERNPLMGKTTIYPRYFDANRSTHAPEKGKVQR